MTNARKSTGLAALALAATATAVLTAAGRPAPPGRGRPEDTVCQDIAALSQRVSALEQAAGIASASTSDGRSLEDAYAALQSRTERLAELQDSVWSAVPTISPVRDGLVTSPYTSRRFHPIKLEFRSHFGTDIAAPKGTPVRATAGGVVSGRAVTPDYGLGIEIDHGNGFITRYGHASRFLAEPGDTVAKGQPIALVGETGVATGPHLHYEVYLNGWSVDPVHYIRDGLTRVASP